MNNSTIQHVRGFVSDQSGTTAIEHGLIAAGYLATAARRAPGLTVVPRRRMKWSDYRRAFAPEGARPAGEGKKCKHL